MKNIIIIKFMLLLLGLLLCCNIILIYIYNNLTEKDNNNIEKPQIIQVTELNPSISKYDDIYKEQLEIINQKRIQHQKEIKEEIEEEVSYNDDDLKYMSCIIYCEAGNQSIAGKQAVGIVVVNRVNNKKFKNSIKEVIHEPGQFRAEDDELLNKAFKMYDNNEIPQECIEAAKYALDGNTVIIYEDQEIDMSEYLYFARYWKDAKITIQDHDFK